MKLIVTPAAMVDLKRLNAFLQDKNPAAAQRAVRLLGQTIQSLDFAPDRGRPSGNSEIRELIVPFGRSAYILRYAYDANKDEAVIIRIWHGRESRD